MRFLSEEFLLPHKEYLKKLKLKYSILRKSVPSLEGLELSGILKERLPDGVREESFNLLSEIILHELYFNSFSDTPYLHSEAVTREYGSEGAFLNEVYRRSLSSKESFCLVARLGGRTVISAEDSLYRLLARGEALFAIDLAEHAYFGDFGFDKERYLENALTYLNLTAADKK